VSGDNPISSDFLLANELVWIACRFAGACRCGARAMPEARVSRHVRPAQTGRQPTPKLQPESKPMPQSYRRAAIRIRSTLERCPLPGVHDAVTSNT
jgi:hypothetical protein